MYLRYPLYLVGGAVRDVLLGTPAADLDLTVEGDGMRMAQALAQTVGGRVVARSQFGTARIRAGMQVADIATARRERYSRPGSLPVVAPGSLQEDLARRDFSIHAMAVALMPGSWGELVDPNGGRQDLEAGQIRVLHQGSFQDDPTRMIRAVRYAQRLGCALEPRTEELLRRDASYLRLVSGPRRWKELQRLLEEVEPEGALLWARRLGLMTQVHPALDADPGLSATFIAARQAAEGTTVPSVLYLCLMALRMSVRQRQEVIADFRPAAGVAKALGDLEQVQAALPQLALPHLKPSRAVQLVERASLSAIQAWSIAAESPVVRERLGDYLRRWRSLKPGLSSETIVRLGVPRGPLLGHCRAALRAARLDGLSASQEAETAFVRAWLADR